MPENSLLFLKSFQPHYDPIHHRLDFLVLCLLAYSRNHNLCLCLHLQLLCRGIFILLILYAFAYSLSPLWTFRSFIHFRFLNKIYSEWLEHKIFSVYSHLSFLSIVQSFAHFNKRIWLFYYCFRNFFNILYTNALSDTLCWLSHESRQHQNEL